jgi:hypothetical protein
MKLKIRLKIREGWSTLGLLALMLLIVAWSINSAEWTEGLAILQWVVLASLAIGLILAKSRLPGFVAHFLSLISGTVWVTFLVCTLLPFNLSWTEKLLNLADRLTTWFQMVLGEESSLDSLIFVLALCLVHLPLAQDLGGDHPQRRYHAGQPLLRSPSSGHLPDRVSPLRSASDRAL